MLTFSRGVIVVGSAALIALGLFLATEADAGFAGLISAAIGVGGLVAIAAERMRYHAETEARERPSPGSPGGLLPGEPLEPRFRPTDEIFVDPTTGRRMRVHVDPTTGERRYRAES